jgi:hypothetical protein
MLYPLSYARPIAIDLMAQCLKPLRAPERHGAP